jgi:NAD(P)H-dependent FMN reductase
MAETTAREMGRVSLLEALDLTALIALKDPRRRSRAAARWLERLLEAHPSPTIEELSLAAAALCALGGPGHDEAATSLVALAERVAR